MLLICVDDLRPELNCYGVDYIESPHIDSLARSGRLFSNHYVQAPTCGSSRYALLTGSYGPSDNGALFTRASKMKTQKLPPSLPGIFMNHGYTTVSVGKISHHPGGMGGRDWNDPEKLEMPKSWNRHLLPCGEWQHPRGAMHGLAHGEIRKRTKDMAVYQSEEGPDDIYPDGLITNTALEQLEQLATASQTDDKPFFLAVGLIKPHLPFGSPAKYMQPYLGIDLPAIPHPKKPEGLSTWHPSFEFTKYNTWGKDAREDDAFATEVRRHYAACVTYADAQIGRILQKLDELKVRENTIIVVWGDHGWHLGEHGIWGKHSLYEEALHAPLIINAPGMGDKGKANSSIVETIDIYPTLCDLADIKAPKEIHGSSLLTLLVDAAAKSDELAISYKEDAHTIRSATHRLIRHFSEAGETTGYELYDHRSPDRESVNLANEQPDLVKQLEAQLKAKIRD